MTHAKKVNRPDLVAMQGYTDIQLPPLVEAPLVVPAAELAATGAGASHMEVCGCYSTVDGWAVHCEKLCMVLSHLQL